MTFIISEKCREWVVSAVESLEQCSIEYSARCEDTFTPEPYVATVGLYSTEEDRYLSDTDLTVAADGKICWCPPFGQPPFHAFPLQVAFSPLQQAT